MEEVQMKGRTNHHITHKQGADKFMFQ